MNLFARIESDLIAILTDLTKAGTLPDGLDFSRVNVEPPRDASHGDMAINAAMVLAKPAAMKPRDLAAILVDKLTALEHVVSAEIAGPGFVNLSLAASFWVALVPEILRSGLGYGSSERHKNVPINIEYVSANPTGPMHVGHARGAVFGDALARLLEKTGHQVLREYYINDAGSQVDVLAQSALLRMREALGEDIGEIPAGLYPGDYLVPVGAALAAQYGTDLLSQDEAAQIKTAKAMALPMMMEMIRGDLAALGIEHKFFLSEQSLHDDGSVEAAFDTLQQAGLVYHGVLEPPKGKEPPADWEAAPQWLFKSSQFGDDSDRALRKSDGAWTYFAPDIACHFNKFNRGYQQMIDVWGADHIGYIKRMQSAVTAITSGQGTLEVKVCNMVKLQRGGEPVKMSKRSGDFVTLREVVDEVGKDVVRFMMLTRKNDAPLDFDFDLVKQKSRENPVFYVQYAHARICSVLRNASQVGLDEKLLSDAALSRVDVSCLQDPAELGLIRNLANYPRLLASAAEAREPHRVAFYLQDLAAQFHALWNLGKEQTHLRFIQEDDISGSLARLALLRATAVTIACGLDVIGVEPEQEMR